MMDDRRPLAFSSLGEVMPEVDRLLKGHRTVGNWSLGQICNHLSGAVIGSVDGIPFRFPLALRKTVGPMLFRRMLRSGRFPEGIKLPRHIQPRSGVDARAEAESLRAAIRLFGSHAGPFAEHPLGGPLDREEWQRFHTLHCAHHLSFVVPEAAMDQATAVG
jgi:hypothetical protein